LAWARFTSISDHHHVPPAGLRHLMIKRKSRFGAHSSDSWRLLTNISERQLATMIYLWLYLHSSHSFLFSRLRLLFVLTRGSVRLTAYSGVLFCFCFLKSFFFCVHQEGFGWSIPSFMYSPKAVFLPFVLLFASCLIFGARTMCHELHLSKEEQETENLHLFWWIWSETITLGQISFSLSKARLDKAHQPANTLLSLSHTTPTSPLCYHLSNHQYLETQIVSVSERKDTSIHPSLKKKIENRGNSKADKKGLKIPSLGFRVS